MDEELLMQVLGEKFASNSTVKAAVMQSDDLFSAMNIIRAMDKQLAKDIKKAYEAKKRALAWETKAAKDREKLAKYEEDTLKIKQKRVDEERRAENKKRREAERKTKEENRRKKEEERQKKEEERQKKEEEKKNSWKYKAEQYKKKSKKLFNGSAEDWNKAGIFSKVASVLLNAPFFTAFAALVLKAGKAFKKAIDEANTALKDYSERLKSINAISAGGFSRTMSSDIQLKKDLTDKVKEYKKTYKGTNNVSNYVQSWTPGEKRIMKDMIGDLSAALVHNLEAQLNSSGISSKNLLGTSQLANKIALDYAREMHPYLNDLELKLTDEYSEAFQNAAKAAISGGSINNTAFSTEGWQAYALQYGYNPGVEYTQTAISDMQTRYLNYLSDEYAKAGGGDAGWSVVNDIITENKKQSMILDRMAKNLYSFDEIIKVDAFSTADTIDEAARELNSTITNNGNAQTARDTALQSSVEDILSDGKITLDELKGLYDQGYTRQQIESEIAKQLDIPITQIHTALDGVETQVATGLGGNGPIAFGLGNEGDIVLYLRDILNNMPAETGSALKDIPSIHNNVAGENVTKSGDYIRIGDRWYKKTDLSDDAKKHNIPTTSDELSESIENTVKYGGLPNRFSGTTKSKDNTPEVMKGSTYGMKGNYLYNPLVDIPEVDESFIGATTGKKYKKGANGVWYIDENAHGGIATAPTLSMVAEAGSDEAIIPLNSEGIGVLSQALQQAGSTGSISVTVNLDGINIAEDDRKWEEVGRRIGTVIENNLRRTGSM